MATALVTGATGLVGSHVVERLAAEGWQVRSLVRDPRRAAWLSAMGSSLSEGDVLDATSFTQAASDCDVIVHAAALVTGRGAWQEFRRMNVDGTLNAITAAERAGARLVQVSSVAVYGARGRYRSQPTSEEVPLHPVAADNHYGRSKRESEQLVMQAHADGRIWATAVRPDVVYGPRDRQFIPRFGRLLDRGIMPLFGAGTNTLAIVQAANVADGIVRAAAIERAGGRSYNLANDFDVTVRDFVRLAAEGLGRRVRTVRIPARVGRLAIGMAAAVLRATRGASFAAQTRSSFDFLARDNPFTSQRAHTELGWAPPVSPEVGIPEAFAWWKRQGSV